MVRRIVLCAAIALGAGCARNGYERFVPSEEIARNALELVLDQWQKGEPIAGISGGKPATIQPIDSQRKPGQKLLRYEVLGEVSGGGPKCYVVHAYLDLPREEQKIRYVIVGQDPLWVVRHEDYVMLEQWSHPMGKDDPKPGTKSK